MSTKQEVERFQAKDEAGKAYDVVKYQTYTTKKLGNGETIKIKDTVEYALGDGGDLSLVEETFKIVANGKVIRKA